MSDPDDTLRERLRERIGQKAEAESTESEADGEHGPPDDEEEMPDDDGEDEVEDEAEIPPGVEEGAQLIAEAADVDPAQVVEMLGPLFEDTRDDGQELAGEDDEPTGVSEEAIDELVESIKADGVVTEEELDERVAEVKDAVDEKLDSVVDALADETRDVIQEANVGGTPAPNATSNGTEGGNVALFSDEKGGEDE